MTADMAEVLRDAVRVLADEARAHTAEDWERPTPCEGWDSTPTSTPPGATASCPTTSASSSTGSSAAPRRRLRRPGLFGPQLPAPEGASPTEELMALLGRSRPGADA